MKWVSTLIFIFHLLALGAQNSTKTSTITGQVKSESGPVTYANVWLEGTHFGTATDTTGRFELKQIPPGNYVLMISSIGYHKSKDSIRLKAQETLNVKYELALTSPILDQVVVSGTMKEVSRLDSPVPVEVFSARYFRANPSPTIFEALQNVNGVRPQINCNVCNTGDIHINGMEGPYTMVLIDGMPIVSGLATVYGLNGIPQSLIDRLEVVKGPASTLYGSEAVGGLINVITQNPLKAPVFAADVWSTDWKEINTDLSGKITLGDRVQTLVGLNYYRYQNPEDRNRDLFTDVPLQHRISLFSKWDFDRPEDRIFSLAARYIYEDRWGGDMRWNRTFRGGDLIYGESIYTSRWEIFGTYQLPFRENFTLQFSINGHDQDSRYGNISYIARQNIAFTQTTWRKTLQKHDVLTGIAFRYTYYDDNTTATGSEENGPYFANQPSSTYLPGLFIQDEWSINDYHKLLLGIRYDYNSIHGSIASPRVNYKWTSPDQTNILRISIGNGYRVAHVFTEDHAALTGSRQVEFWEDLRPETSWNANLNYVKKIYAKDGTFINLDGSAFYTKFSNKIIADYDIDPNKIIYQNLEGIAISEGLSVNLDVAFPWGLSGLVGATLQEVYSREGEHRSKQLFTETFSGVWNISYLLQSIGLQLDYTGNLYSPMRLPLLSDLDPRREYSPWWSIQNVQLTKTFVNGLEIYAGVKNLLNWTPNRNNPFIIARSHDPFDQQVVFDENDRAIPTIKNPYGLTFDPTYVYGPNQGLRGFVGIRLIVE